MPNPWNNERLGTARIEPAGAVTAGSVGTWTLVYTVGAYGIDEGGTIKLAQRFASDWEMPQFDRPSQSGYATLSTTGQAHLRPHVEPKGHERPWMKCLVIDVYDGHLAPGDTVTLVLGDRRGGAPGIRAQTFRETAHEFRFFIDPTNACVARRLPHSPTIPIVAGAPIEWVCLMPSQATVGCPVDVFVKGQDIWGNPTPVAVAPVLQWDGTGEVTFQAQRLLFRTPGQGCVIARSGEFICRSNPLAGHAAEPSLKHYWGDLHAQTDATVGTGTEEEYFIFGRDLARLDFISHQGNDFQVTDDDWRRLNRAVRRFHADGRFVVFPGYEWSGNTSAGGDRNVFYAAEDLPILRSSHWQTPETPEDAATPAHPADVLFARLREQIGNDQALVGAHVGGRYADVRRFFDDEIGTLMEVASCWGIFEWLLWDALEAGHVAGVMCNSDGHKGRPGAEGPGAGEFGIAGGLTCVLAERHTRRAIWEALRRRRCYGTTGPRLILDFRIDGQPMGSFVRAAEPARATASVLGTGPIESLTLLQGRVPVLTRRPAAFDACAGSRRVRVSWRGARIRGRARRACWDGAIRLEGARLAAARPFQFDSPLEGIVSQTDRALTFKSHTMGDTDGFDLTLDDATRGVLHFESAVGQARVALAELGAGASAATFAFGGLDLALRVERYPETLTENALALDTEVRPPADGRAPYLVKVVQEDGHQAWTSPIYLAAPPVSRGT